MIIQPCGDSTMPVNRLIWILAALAVCGTCTINRGEAPRTAPGPGLQVEVDAPGRVLILSNGGTAAVYYTILERRFAARANWAACRVPGQCPSVPPAGRTPVAIDSIAGYDSDARDVIVYWWRLKNAANGTLRPDSVRSHIVPIGLAPR
ncbi:MAG TPA: hypothetical protein VEX86_12100 [Longimicrobium sp.]|nr:hypothetical protein [Longimicrobium sp.]